MTDSKKLSSLNLSYGELSFAQFVEQYETLSDGSLKGKAPKARLFELTLPWLAATEAFTLPENSQVIVHCLYQSNEGQEPILSIAWPLVHIFNDSKSSKNHIT